TTLMLGSGSGVAAEIGVQTTTAQIRSAVKMSFLFSLFMFLVSLLMAEIFSRLLANRNRRLRTITTRCQLTASGQNVATARPAHKRVHAFGFQNLAERFDPVS